MGRKRWSLLRDNLLPLLVLLGLVGGAILRFGFGQPDSARWVWLAALVVGGTPLVLATVRGMLRGNFAADVVATLSIVTALAMGEYFAGLIIVLMQSGGEALERYSLRRASSALAVALATLANTLVKGGIVAAAGTPALRRAMARPAMLMLGGVGAVALALFVLA